jgi:hypothetical protein
MLILLGFVGVIATATLVLFLIQRKIIVRWYEWILGAIAIALLFLSIQHYFGSLNEYEPRAGAFGLALLGVLAIIIAALDFQLVWRRNRKASNPA